MHKRRKSRWMEVKVPVVGSRRSIADRIGAIARPGYDCC